MGKKVAATAYLVMVPDIVNRMGVPTVANVRVVKSTVGKPKLERNEIAVKVTLNFDEDSLIRAIPEISVDVDGFATPLMDILTSGK